MISSAVALLLAFVAQQVAAPPQGTAYDFDAPPPGSAEDQALWKAAYEANNQVLVERSRASRLQTRATSGGFQARLEALAGKPGAPEGAAGVRERFLSAWVENVGINTRQWPVDPTRACRNQALTFESAMRDDNPARRGASLPEARSNLKVCLDKARLVLSALMRSSDRFEASLAEADRLLAAAGSPASRSTSAAPSAKASGEGAR